MQTYETEEQQVEAIRKWIKENGKSTVWTVVIVVGLVFGFRYWKHHQDVVRMEASEVYSAMMLAAEQKDITTAQSKANTLASDYKGSAYADLAALYLAKSAVDAKDLAGAETHLQKVIKHSKISDFQYIARARLARLYLAQDKPELALPLFDVPEESGYYTLLQELKGDALLALNKTEEAKAAYLLAYKTIDDVQRPILKLKLEELGALDVGSTSQFTNNTQSDPEVS